MGLDISVIDKGTKIDDAGNEKKQMILLIDLRSPFFNTKEFKEFKDCTEYINKDYRSKREYEKVKIERDVCGIERLGCTKQQNSVKSQNKENKKNLKLKIKSEKRSFNNYSKQPK